MKTTPIKQQYKKFTPYTVLIFLTCVLSGFYCGCQGEMFNFNIDGASFEIVEKSGELTENEVWDGRIYITSTVVVPEGITLTIRSGTIVGFEPTDTPSELIVYGELYAEGSPERMIVFGSLGKQRKIEQSPIAKTTTPAFATNPSTMEGHGDTAPGIPKTVAADPPRAGDWAGIQIEATSPNSRLTYCRIQHATVGIRARTDAVQIESCLFSENNTGVLCESTNPTISRNEFNRNGIGTKLQGSASPEVEYNEFTANEYGISCEDDSRPRIQYNILRANYQNAITCYSTASPEIVSNNITMNIGWAVYDGGRLRDNFIQGNKQVGPNITELGIGTQSDQFYGVEESFEPRNSPVTEAGVPRENF
ncbi:MAG: right-handed parallel beta-helix repeat-containing protein [Candidatus Poribacteria bacterium]|nr:right-handed parallel beta-helix repeat-containing protein [Candidatus Poribacteria bacterium]